MNIIVERKALESALRRTAGFLADESPLPDFENFCLEASAETITVTAFNYAASCEAVIPAKVRDPGKLLMEKKLLDVVKKLPEGEVAISPSGSEGKVKVTSGGSRFVLNGLDGKNFVLPAAEDAVFAARLKTDDFAALVGAVKDMVSRQEIMPALKCICFELSESELRAVGLDGYRLSLKKVPVETVPGQEAPERLLISAEAASKAAGALPKGEEMKILAGESMVFFETENVRIGIRRFEGEFLDYEPLISRKEDTVISTDREALFCAVQRAMIIAKEEKNAAVLLKADPDTGSVTIKTSAVSEAFCEDVPSQIDGKPLEIAFNGGYFMDALQNAPDERIVIKCGDAVSPLVASSEEYLQMILPIRIEAM